MPKDLIFKKIICSILVTEDNKQIYNFLSRIKENDWYKVFNFLTFFEVCPLFYSKTRQHAELVPKNILNNLKIYYHAASAEYMKGAHDLNKILSITNEQNLDVILIKGVYLGDKYYNNPVTRTMHDIDLLVKKDDAMHVAELIQELGYRFNRKFEPETWLKHEKHLPELIMSNKRAIELHCELKFVKLPGTPEVRINTDNIWNRAEQKDIKGKIGYTMSVEDIILHLCMEIVQDKFKQCLIKMLDIHNLISKENINWNIVKDRAKIWNINKILFIIISSVENIFNTKLNDFYDEINKFTTENYQIMEIIENHLLSVVNTNAHSVEDNIISEFQNRSLKEKIIYLFYGFFSTHVICRTYGLDENSNKKYFYYIPRALFILKNYFKKTFILYFLKKNNNLENKSINYIQILNWLKE